MKITIFTSNDLRHINLINIISKISKNRFINKNVKCKFIKHGDLNFLNKQDISEVLNSDLYIVFGSSFIKGWLVDFLVKKKTINIHMGISPYYRGSSCNFWALYDNNPHLVGATLHYLSKGLDSGKIITHVLPDKKFRNIFEYTMSSVKNAHTLLAKKIKNRTILSDYSFKQNRNLEIKYSKNKDFNDKIVKIFFKKKISIKHIKKIIKSSFDKKDFIGI